MNNQILEVLIENDDHNFEIAINYEETIDDVKSTIMRLYGYKDTNSFETYIDNFHLNDFYNHYKIKEIIDYFQLEKIRIKDSKCK